MKVNQSVSGKPLLLHGNKFDVGLGMKTGSAIEFDLQSLFHEFTALAGVDDSGKNSDVIFTVTGDGKELWKSGVVKQADGAKPISILIDGVNQLVLRAQDAGIRKSGNSVDWCNPIIRKNDQ